MSNPIDIIGNIVTGGLLGVGKGIASGNIGKALGADPGVAGIAESVGRGTIGPTATQITRAGIGAGAGAAGALSSGAEAGASPSFGANLAEGGANTGASPQFGGGVTSTTSPTGTTEIIPEHFGFDMPLGLPTASGSFTIPTADIPAIAGPGALGTGTAAAGAGLGEGLTATRPEGQEALTPPPAPGGLNLGPTDLTTTMPQQGAAAGGAASGMNMTKALLALQALQMARGFAGGAPAQQAQDQTAMQDPQAAIAQAQAQQQADQQRAILAALPRADANAAAAGLSGASPDFLAMMTAQGAGMPNYDALALVERYLSGQGRA